MLSNPFILLIVYLLFVLLAIYILRLVLTQMRVDDPANWIITLVVGALLLLLAFSMSGVGAMLL